MQNKNPVYRKNPNTDNNISKTGYRALFLLMKLLESPKTRVEILDCFQEDLIIKNTLSKDSVTNTINALRKSGCVISRPTQRTANKYVLKSHPFTITLSKDNIDALQALRESIVTLGDWELLRRLNSLYMKFSLLAPDDESRNLLIFSHPLANINNKILNELVICAKIKRHTNICYNSPENGEEDLDFSPEFVTFESRKLYVWGYCKKYNRFSYLRIDRILRVNVMDFLGKDPEIQEFQKPIVVVEYKLKGLSALMYTEHEEEILISCDENAEYPVRVKCNVSNKFNFFQRILSYGTDCELIGPESIREEFLSILKSIKSVYQNDKI